MSCYALLALLLAASAQAAAQHHSSHNYPVQTKDISNEDLLRQIQQWQQVLISPQPTGTYVVQSQNNNNQHRYNTGGEQYGGNPWLQPTPVPPSYGETSPASNPWYRPTTARPTPPPQTGGYYPPPQTGGGPYPPTGGQGGVAPAPTHPPPSPETEALRKYCLKPRGQFPSDKCNTYVNCWDDVVVEQECPTGLVFSELGYCDYPYNVDCSGRPIAPTPPPTLPDGQQCPTPYGSYRNAKNCSEFFICVNSVPYKFSCPDDLYFNTELGVCDYQYNVDCKNPYPKPTYPQPSYPQPSYPQPSYPQQSYPPQSYPTAPPTTGLPPPSPIYQPYRFPIRPEITKKQIPCIPNAVLRLEQDCSSVAICRGGSTEVITCGKNTGYDSEKGECVPKPLARC